MMDKLVILELDGTWETGFRVSLNISDTRGRFLGRIKGNLPANLDLLQQLTQHWETEFRGIEKHDRIRPKRVVKLGSINERLQQCKISANRLRDRFNNWLERDEFQPVINLLREELNRQDETRFLIQTSDSEIQKLPWSEWDFFKRFERIEASLSPLELKPPLEIPRNNAHPKVKILAILGHSEGINIESDRETLESLPHSYVKFLVEPQKWQINDQLWEQEWDIIFFAGHSETESKDDRETGRLYLNSNQNIPLEERSVTVNELWYGLKRATEKGLRLAIFNSCDGLGLARSLNDSLIPQAIVMREVVPDKIAQAFLRHFLTTFAEGATFYNAVKEARERLTNVRLTYQNSPTETLEFECPCATWLPVICEHPAAIPPLWTDLYHQPEPPPPPPFNKPWWQGLPKVALTSGICTALVMGIRWLGLLQGIELAAFDLFLRSRPLEEPDPRILIVAADEEDLRLYAQSTGSSLPDRTLTQLINKLKQHQPTTIGLRITRDRPVGSGYESFQNQLENTPELIVHCNIGHNLAPPKVLINKLEQVGFSDYRSDSLTRKEGSEIIRRGWLYRDTKNTTQPSLCNASHSFSFRLAYRYLEANNIPVKPIEKLNTWQFGQQKLPPFKTHNGGYQKMGGSDQFIINYRHLSEFENIAKTVTLRDVLQNTSNFDPDWIRNRIVLIGMNAPTRNTIFDTPYGKVNNLFVSAHVISHLMSAAEDNRPFFWWLPQWGDLLLVFGVSSVCALILLKLSRSSYQILGLSVVSVIWVGGCWFIFLHGGWLPLVPALLSASLTSIASSKTQSVKTFSVAYS
jgi:CHASE2 domain-containing sensor protein